MKWTKVSRFLASTCGLEAMELHALIVDARGRKEGERERTRREGCCSLTRMLFAYKGMHICTLRRSNQMTNRRLICYKVIPIDITCIVDCASR